MCPQHARAHAPRRRATQIELYGQCPPIEKMDATLSTLKACRRAAARRSAQRRTTLRRASVHTRANAQPLHCAPPPHPLPPARRHLALSTNNIEKISSLAGMDSLRVLSLGRNLIKKASGAQRRRRTAQ